MSSDSFCSMKRLSHSPTAAATPLISLADKWNSQWVLRKAKRRRSRQGRNSLRKSWKVFLEITKTVNNQFDADKLSSKRGRRRGAWSVTVDCIASSSSYNHPLQEGGRRRDGGRTVDWMDLTLSAIKITSWLLVWLWLCLLTACHKKVLWCRRQCPERGREREGGREQHSAGRAPAGAPSLRLFCCMSRSLDSF